MLLAAIVVVGLAEFARPATDPPEVWARAITAHIDAHEFEDALDKASLALEHWPDDAVLLDLASLAALENGEKDIAL